MVAQNVLKNIDMEKKPDNVVWDEEEQKYISSILPYGSNVGAPSINIDDVKGFKKRGAEKVQKIFNTKYNELVDEYNNLIDEVNLNELLYSSVFSFTPIIGETYHLYERKNGEYFLSLICPNEWNMKFLVSVRLNSEQKWVTYK